MEKMVDILSFRGQMEPSRVEENLKGIQTEGIMDKCTEVGNDKVCVITISLLIYSII